MAEERTFEEVVAAAAALDRSASREHLDRLWDIVGQVQRGELKPIYFMPHVRGGIGKENVTGEIVYVVGFRSLALEAIARREQGCNPQLEAETPTRTTGRNGPGGGPR